MFEQALAARLPVITITTDDPINVAAVLGAHAKQAVKEYKGTGPIHQKVIFVLDTPANDVEFYQKMVNAEATCVVVNPTREIVGFDGGVLPVPDSLIETVLTDLGWSPENEPLEKMINALRGLSVKAISEVCQLAQAEFGLFNVMNVRKMRAKLSPPSTGLISVGTDIGWYEPEASLADWQKLVRPYFLKPNSPDRLAPRGLMFSGPPGTGKTTAAKYIAREWGVPLYRLDLATTLSKYIGESEAKMARTLSAVDREAPCVLLIDEVEKVFRDDDHGAVTRILSQLLWWLAEHRTRVFVVMTTNHQDKLPPELYRPGRMDRVFELEPLTSVIYATDFATKVLEEVLPQATKEMKSTVRMVASGWSMPKSQAEATEIVLNIIRTQRW